MKPIDWDVKQKRKEEFSEYEFKWDYLSIREQKTMHLSKVLTPFPSINDFIHYNDTKGKPPFKIDIVFYYYGYRPERFKRNSVHHGDLQYSLRSIFFNMPWFNNIYIICSDELADKLSKSSLWPPWLNREKLQFTTKSNKKHHSIRFIAQSSLIFWDKKNAKHNRNRVAFEINMHRIKSLEENFIYFSDNIYIGRPLTWKYFYWIDKNGFIPRMPYSIFLKYFIVSDPNKYQRDTQYLTTYDCDITLIDKQWKGKRDQITHLIPKRVDKFESNSPKPLTKRIFLIFTGKYPSWFRFVEGHKRTFCCPNYKSESNFQCWKQENLFLTLYKEYIEFNIKINVMNYPKHNNENVHVNNKDLINFYHPDKHNIKYQTTSILRIKPYTFSINNYFTNNQEQKIKELEIFHNFANKYWPNTADFERDISSDNIHKQH